MTSPLGTNEKSKRVSLIRPALEIRSILSMHHFERMNIFSLFFLQNGSNPASFCLFLSDLRRLHIKLDCT